MFFYVKISEMADTLGQNTQGYFMTRDKQHLVNSIEALRSTIDVLNEELQNPKFQEAKITLKEHTMEDIAKMFDCDDPPQFLKIPITQIEATMSVEIGKIARVYGNDAKADEPGCFIFVVADITSDSMMLLPPPGIGELT